MKNKKNLIVGGVVLMALLVLGCVAFITTRGGNPEEVVAEVEIPTDEQVIENDNQFAQDIVMRAESEAEPQEQPEEVETEPTEEEVAETEVEEESTSLVEVVDADATEETEESAETTEKVETAKDTTSKASTSTKPSTSADVAETNVQAPSAEEVAAQLGATVVHVANDGAGRDMSGVETGHRVQ